MSDTYEIYAVKYGRHARKASANFIGGDPHDGPMPLDYFVWAIVGGSRTFVVDTGFAPEVGRRRGREPLTPAQEGLRAIGVDPARVADVIISHMHYDHAGNPDLFPAATYHIQDREMEYCTGRCMGHGQLRHSFEADDVAAMVQKLYAGRLQFHDGIEEIAPGISLHLVGGHAVGLQCVRVMTRRGPVVVASDATHFYANFEQGRPYPTVYNVGDMLEGHQTLKRLAASPAHIIPGHDPLVMKRYPAARPELEALAVRVDVDPMG